MSHEKEVFENRNIAFAVRIGFLIIKEKIIPNEL